MRCFVCGNEWDVSPESILHGNGCPKCGIKNRIDKRRMKKEDFIERSEMMHGVGRYLYDRSIILGWDYETEIYCTKCNVYFKQLVSNHLQGKGCPYCSESKLEKFVRNILNNNNIFYEYEAHFNWLGRQTIDFYLPKYHVGIECQGEQHFKRTDNRDFFNYESVLERDIRKFNLCMENKLNLFYLITDKINLSNELKKDGRLNEIYNNENILYKNNILNFIKNL